MAKADVFAFKFVEINLNRSFLKVMYYRAKYYTELSHVMAV